MYHVFLHSTIFAYRTIAFRRPVCNRPSERCTTKQKQDTFKYPAFALYSKEYNYFAAEAASEAAASTAEAAASVAEAAASVAVVAASEAAEAVSVTASEAAEAAEAAASVVFSAWPQAARNKDIKAAANSDFFFLLPSLYLINFKKTKTADHYGTALLQIHY